MNFLYRNVRLEGRLGSRPLQNLSETLAVGDGLLYVPIRFLCINLLVIQQKLRFSTLS